MKTPKGLSAYTCYISPGELNDLVLKGLVRWASISKRKEASSDIKCCLVIANADQARARKAKAKR